jgi:Putative F0F1-ATPase subunit Ca2+/Mg2+ transporter
MISDTGRSRSKRPCSTRAPERPIHSGRMARPWNELGRYGGVGIDLVLAILLLGALGHWLDGRYWPGRDTGMIVGGLLGVAVGVRNLVRTAQRMQKDIEAAEARDPEAGHWKVDPGWLHETDDASQKPPDEPPR